MRNGSIVLDKDKLNKISKQKGKDFIDLLTKNGIVFKTNIIENTITIEQGISIYLLIPENRETIKKCILRKGKNT